MNHFRIALAGLLVLVSACSSGIPQEEHDEALATISQLEADLTESATTGSELAEGLAAAEAKVEALEGTVAAGTTTQSELQSRVEDLEEQVRDLVRERDESIDAAEVALAATEAAQQALDQVLLEYDSEIRAAANRAQGDAEELACVTARDSARNGGSVPNAQAISDEVLAVIELAIDLTLDLAAISDAAQTCFDDESDDIAAEVAAEEAAAEEAAKQARLTADKRDGFYTVGEEIAPGLWRSTGSQDDCYWARYNSSQGILDNHFGNAGGTVRIRTSDYEVEFDDCGTWEYLGP